MLPKQGLIAYMKHAKDLLLASHGMMSLNSRRHLLMLWMMTLIRLKHWPHCLIHPRLLNKALDAGEDAAALSSQFDAMSNLLGIVQHGVDEWFQGGDADADAIEALISERLGAKKDRDFARADAIRDDLATKGITLEDSPAGTTWKKV